jgi:uncharacterized membrane protein
VLWGLTVAGAAHTLLAMFGILVGSIQLLRPKRGPAHRARGYAFVYAMLVADGAALLVYRFTGSFNVLHAGALMNLACVVLAMVPVLRSPRPANWKTRHYYWMSWSYVGLLAAAGTELVVRGTHLESKAQAWAATAGVTAIVTMIGAVLIARNWPVSASPQIPGGMTPQDGAQS